MKLSELKKYIEENITEILSEEAYAGPEGVAGMKKDAGYNKLNSKAKMDAEIELKKGGIVNLEEKKDEDEEVEDTYGKEDEDDKKDAKIANAEPSKSELKKLDKEFSSTKLAKKLTPADQEKLNKLETGIKKKLANPTKDNIEIVRQLIKKPEIKKLFKDGGKDLKALISDIIR
jgi:hypothetical protein